MKIRLLLSSVLPLLLASMCSISSAQQSALPHLEKRGAATQLIVDGKPFLMLSGELHNSSSSNLDYMKPIWPKLAALGLNTVVTPLSWELVEPTEGHFDFTLVDGLIDQARAAHQRIVFLWLASWKNGMSSYAPAWVKADTQRFPRVFEYGQPVEILSPLGQATEQADAHAFAALMRHIKQVDGAQHTVLMMQVENEVGVLGDSRDHSPTANKAFDSAVPAELTAYLKAHYNQLYPDLRDRWDAQGDKTTGTWTEVFGDSQRTDEIFMAWNYGRYIQAVAKAGKAEYDLPMCVNTWLAGDSTPPGEFPSGCPEPWVVDVWRAAGSSLDLYAPDLYDPRFELWSQRYHRDGNPLYMPETRGGEAGAANVFYALGQEAAIGFSPFAIESEANDKDPLGASYHALASILPLILQHQAAGDIRGFVVGPNVDFTLNGYTLHVTLDEIFGSRAKSGYGILMAIGKDEFLGIGQGFRVTFTPRPESGPRAGIASIDEGEFKDGKWVPGRRLNGDENAQGKSWRFDSRAIHIEKIKLYRFE